MLGRNEDLSLEVLNKEVKWPTVWDGIGWISSSLEGRAIFKMSTHSTFSYTVLVCSCCSYIIISSSSFHFQKCPGLKDKSCGHHTYMR